MRHNISFRIAFAVGLLALAGSVAASIPYYFYSYARQVKESQHTLLQLGQTVQSTASIAAYLNDRELANEVIQGLLKNEIVAAVKLTSVTGMSIPPESFSTRPDDHIVSMDLYSPFTKDEVVGELLIAMNQELINNHARKSAWSNTAILGSYTLVMALLVFMLIESRFIHGIKQIASNLNHITPGQQDRLPSLPRHRNDEVGGLLDNINKLLNLAQNKLENERALLSQMESLEKHYRMIYERAGVGIFLMDQDARFVMANQAFREIVGDDAYLHIQNQDINCMSYLFSESEKTSHLLQEASSHNCPSSADLLIDHEGHAPRWVFCLLTPLRDDSSLPHSNQIFLQGIITEITERKNEEQQIRFHAERDSLTQLLNRRSAEHSLGLILEKTAYEDLRVAVCLVDLDNFKPVNDTHGHDAGDIVLKQTATRMAQLLRNTDLIARWGGDEFLLVIQGVIDMTDLEHLLNKLVDSITEEIDIGNGVTVQIGASIGVALSPDNGTGVDQLLTFADRAMYRVKNDGKKGYKFYDENSF